MPRTLWTRGRGDENKTDRELRDNAEESHWRQLRKPFEWESTGRFDDALEHWIEPSAVYRDRETRLTDLDDQAVRSFCFKDCALYAPHENARTMPWRVDLFSRIFRRWYPSRPEETDISHGAFFCSFMRFQRADTIAQEIGQIVSFHRLLCEQLDKKIPQLPRLDPQDVFGMPADHFLLSPEAVYRLQPTFSKCLLIIRGELTERFACGRIRADPGAVVVWLKAEDAPEPSEGMSRLTIEGIEPAVAFECESVNCAMENVLSMYPDRRDKRRERHVRYQEELDQSNNMYGSACECTHCS